MKRLLAVGVALALCLGLVLPSAVLADSRDDDFDDVLEERFEDEEDEEDEELNAHGTITGISEGDVRPAKKSGWWKVRSREIYGNLEGDLQGDFVLTYKARVDETQAGKFSGKLNLNDGETIIKVKGRSLPFDLIWFEQYNTYLPMLTMHGNWKIKRGDGEGTFQAWFLFIPDFDEQGNMHIAQIVDSAIVMTGERD